MRVNRFIWIEIYSVCVFSKSIAKSFNNIFTVNTELIVASHVFVCPLLMIQFILFLARVQFYDLRYSLQTSFVEIHDKKEVPFFCVHTRFVWLVGCLFCTILGIYLVLRKYTKGNYTIGKVKRRICLTLTFSFFT